MTQKTDFSTIILCLHVAAESQNKEQRKFKNTVATRTETQRTLEFKVTRRQSLPLGQKEFTQRQYSNLSSAT